MFSRNEGELEGEKRRDVEVSDSPFEKPSCRTRIQAS